MMMILVYLQCTFGVAANAFSISRLCENMLKKVLGANWEPLCLGAGLLLLLTKLLVCLSS